MKLAVFNQHVTRAVQESGLSRQNILQRLRQAGITGLEYDLKEINSISDLKQELNECDMQISAICQTCYYEQGMPADLSVIDTAVELGVKQVMLVPGFFSLEIPAERAFSNIVQALQSIVNYAAKKSVTVSVEGYDETTSIAMGTDRLRKLCSAVPELKITFDSGNFLYSGENELTAFDEFHDKIVHFHAKDRATKAVTGSHSHTMLTGEKYWNCAVGAGVVHLPELLQKLRAIGYTDHLVIEHFGVQIMLAKILDSAQYLTEIIDSQTNS